jgi:hypothetical protein
MNFMKHMLNINYFSIFVHAKDIYHYNKGFDGTLPWVMGVCIPPSPQKNIISIN